MLIFGSHAVKHWYPDFRTPKDIDYIAKSGKSSKDIEYHWTDAYQYILNCNKDTKYVDPDFLYTIKVSHAAWDVHWDKTMYDIKFLQSKGCKLNMKLYNLLIKDWEKIHHKKRIVVKGSPAEFFKHNIPRVMDHEELHKLVAFYNTPMHEKLHPNVNDVYCSKDLWEKLSHEDKIRCALEETFVFAFERFSELPPKFALFKALKHLITQSTKGYFNLFLIENFFDLRYTYCERYMQLYALYKEKING